VSKTVFATPVTVSFPTLFMGGKPMVHFCPRCEQRYDCQPELQLICASLHFPHAFRCGTPYHWPCPECAKNIAILSGEKLSVPIPFVYIGIAA